MSSLRATATALVRATLTDLDVGWEEPSEGTFVAVLPGEHKLRTTVSLVLGVDHLTANAFVVRRPDDNHAAVYGWLLRANTRHPGLAFGTDSLGDVYVTAELPLAGLTGDEVDRLLGRVLTACDDSFDTLLELGFAASIAREWQWRHDRGEPTDNLAAFTHLDPQRDRGTLGPAPDAAE